MTNQTPRCLECGGYRTSNRCARPCLRGSHKRVREQGALAECKANHPAGRSMVYNPNTGRWAPEQEAN